MTMVGALGRSDNAVMEKCPEPKRRPLPAKRSGPAKDRPRLRVKTGIKAGATQLGEETQHNETLVRSTSKRRGG
jgi:hypothetical protein